MRYYDTAFIATSSSFQDAPFRLTSRRPFSAVDLSMNNVRILDEARSTSNLLASESSYTLDLTAGATPTGVYEPIMPSTETLLGMGLIVVLCAVVAWVWQNQVVPTSRTNLAISKSRGPVKEYLDELKARDSSSIATSEATNSSQMDLASNNSTMSSLNEDAIAADRNTDSRAFERWLFTDWLRDNKSERRVGGRQKEPALPILKDAKWNSGDNPVLAATLLISLGVIFTSLTERISSLTSM